MTKRTVRKQAEALGHRLGRFKRRKYSGGMTMYHVAWCIRCDATFFAASRDAEESNADYPCKGACQ